MSVKKTSVSFDPSIWDQLSLRDNRSRTINEALRFYFLLENRQAEKEVVWSEEETDFILKELDHYKKTGESYSQKETFSRSF